MQTMVKVAVDAMGGDNAPAEVIKGAVRAVCDDNRVSIVLVGKEDIIKEQLQQYTYDKERITVVHAEEEITNEEAPVMAVRRKKDSSIVKAMNLVKNNEAVLF